MSDNVNKFYPSLKQRHLGVMMWLLEHPSASLTECANAVGYSRSWVSRIVNSPAFKDDLNSRLNLIMKEQIIKSLSFDPNSRFD